MSSDGSPGGAPGGGVFRRIWSSDEYLDDDEKVTRSYVLAARALLIPVLCGFIGAKLGTMLFSYYYPQSSFTLTWSWTPAAAAAAKAN
jgi:hypothetical protein